MNLKIANKKKFIRTMSILIILISSLILFAKNTYSKGEIVYKEDYIYSGDTLWSISRRYGVSIATIVRLNRIQNPNLIYAGQTLRI